MIDAATLIRLLRDGRGVFHTTGETLDLEGRGLRIPETLNWEAINDRGGLRLNLAPGIQIDRAWSWWKISTNAVLSAVILTERDIVAVTNLGRRKIAVLQQAETVYGSAPGVMANAGGFAWLPESEVIE